MLIARLHFGRMILRLISGGSIDHTVEHGERLFPVGLIKSVGYGTQKGANSGYYLVLCFWIKAVPDLAAVVGNRGWRGTLQSLSSLMDTRFIRFTAGRRASDTCRGRSFHSP